MDTIIREINNIKKITKRIKVCAYARVSSEKDSMLNSLSNQISYYSNLIQNHPGWEYSGVYADEGISGTLDKRNQFDAMIKRAKSGDINLIITKSISRFARNTVVLLSTLRDLKTHNVNVYFEEQNIYSLSNDGELMITLLAAFAQEEARSVSENMKWRIKESYQKGELMGSTDNYGYKIVDKEYVLVPEQAEVVRLIFELYIGGKGIVAITKYLNDAGIKPLRADKWSKNTINQILTNVNYIGDLVLQKYYNKDFITKKHKVNKGELPMYYVEEHHEPIISKEIFNKAKKIREERIKKFNIKVGIKYNNYAFTHKIKCSNCGSYYQHKTTKYNSLWVCGKSNQYGKEACNNSKNIPDSQLRLALSEYLQTDELTDELINDKIKLIVAFPNNKLEVHFNDEIKTTIQWKDKSRRDSWTPEMKAKARERSLNYIMKAGEDNGKS